LDLSVLCVRDEVQKDLPRGSRSAKNGNWTDVGTCEGLACGKGGEIQTLVETLEGQPHRGNKAHARTSPWVGRGRESKQPRTGGEKNEGGRTWRRYGRKQPGRPLQRSTEHAMKLSRKAPLNRNCGQASAQGFREKRRGVRTEQIFLPSGRNLEKGQRKRESTRKREDERR